MFNFAQTIIFVGMFHLFKYDYIELSYFYII